jgi:hypothetical protein
MYTLEYAPLWMEFAPHADLAMRWAVGRLQLAVPWRICGCGGTQGLEKGWLSVQGGLARQTVGILRVVAPTATGFPRRAAPRSPPLARIARLKPPILRVRCRRRAHPLQKVHDRVVEAIGVLEVHTVAVACEVHDLRAINERRDATQDTLGEEGVVVARGEEQLQPAPPAHESDHHAAPSTQQLASWRG